MRPTSFSTLRLEDKLTLTLIHEKLRWLLMNMDSNNQLDPKHSRGIMEMLDFDLAHTLEMCPAGDLSGVAYDEVRRQYGNPNQWIIDRKKKA